MCFWLDFCFSRLGASSQFCFSSWFYCPALLGFAFEFRRRTVVPTPRLLSRAVHLLTLWTVIPPTLRLPLATRPAPAAVRKLFPFPLYSPPPAPLSVHPTVPWVSTFLTAWPSTFVFWPARPSSTCCAPGSRPAPSAFHLVFVGALLLEFPELLPRSFSRASLAVRWLFLASCHVLCRFVPVSRWQFLSLLRWAACRVPSARFSAPVLDPRAGLRSQPLLVFLTFPPPFFTLACLLLISVFRPFLHHRRHASAGRICPPGCCSFMALRLAFSSALPYVELRSPRVSSLMFLCVLLFAVLVVFLRFFGSRFAVACLPFCRPSLGAVFLL